MRAKRVSSDVVRGVELKPALNRRGAAVAVTIGPNHRRYVGQWWGKDDHTTGLAVKS